MTATFSQDMLAELAKLLDAVVIPATEEERDLLRDLESQQKIRRYHAETRSLSARAVLDRHQGRSLVICNTVDRARRLYEELEAAKSPEMEVVLLHSRFLPEDRNAIEDGIQRRFGKGYRDNSSLIVVSTQAIEVGVDITSATLHTELAPANSILQRAGRCARYPGEEGDVCIYRYSADPATGEQVDLCEKVQPYEGQSNEFLRTYEQFRERSGAALDFVEEQAVITAVHGERDRAIIQGIRGKDYDHWRKMVGVMQGDKQVEVQDLVRKVYQQQVTIHAEPDALLESPYDAQAFGVYPGTLQGYVKSWLERYQQGDDRIPWAVKYLQEVEDPDADQANRTVYRWVEVHNSSKEVMGAALVVVHPTLATYDSRLGFLADRGGKWQASLSSRDADRAESRYSYRLETYEAHIRHVYEAFLELWPEMDYAARQLEGRFGWEQGRVRQAAELAVLLHDVGKLSVGWQGWVGKYQQEIGEPVTAGEAYAHTLLRTEAHRKAEQSVGKRPWHAVEGAVAVISLLIETFGNDHPLALAAFSAIARHHAPHSDSLQAFRLSQDAARHIAATFAQQQKSPPPLESLQGVSETIPADFGASDAIAQPDKSPAFLPYLLIVRLLRRADHLGTKRGTQL
jgi:CRISPR-associated endonuclease/helicase Cas3